MSTSVEKKMSNAICEGDVDSLERIIDEYGLDYLEDWSGGYNLLIEALSRPRPKFALLLLSKGAKVNTTNPSTSTPLHYAAKGNYVEVVKELLERGATVNASDKSGQTPLHVAVSLIRRQGYLKSNLEIIRLLLENGADVNATDNSGGTPLLYAIRSRESQCVEMLIQYCTNINLKSAVETSEFQRYTPLQYAVRNRKQEVVELLLKNGADVNIGAEHGETALHMAVNLLTGNCQIAQILINSGANVNAVFTSGDFEGYTPLHIAVSAQYFCYKQDDTLKLIEMLATHGANVNAESKDRSIPLHMAIYKWNEARVELLLKHGADPNILSKDNKTALRIAVEMGSSLIVKHILKYSPDWNNDLHADIVRVALFDSSNFSGDLIRHLLDHGFSVANDPNKDSMFYEAVQKGSTAVVEELLNLSFQVNEPHGIDNGWSLNPLQLAVENKLLSYMPLHLAVQKSRLYIARLLVSHGADVNALDKAGKTPISYICPEEYHREEREMLKFLLEKGAKPEDNPGLFLSAFRCHNKDASKLLLLEHDLDVNVKDDLGLSALHYSVFWFFKRCQFNLQSPLKIIRLLLDKKADVNAKTKTDVAVLHTVVLLNSVYRELLQILLEYDADVNIRCGTITPLHLCAFKRNNVFCRVLLEKGADVNAKLEDGKTAAHLIASVGDGCLEAYRKFQRAFEKGYNESGFDNFFSDAYGGYDFEMIKVLVEFGADINAKDDEGKTPLHKAAESKSSKDTLIATLIKHGADWTSRDKHFKTPLDYATQGSMENVRILVELGADINSKDADGCSPLHRLVQSGSSNISRFLNLGSDINVVNNDNQTPLEIDVSRLYLNDAQQHRLIDFKKHIIKLIAANLQVDSKNLIALEMLNGVRNLNFSDYHCECEREVDRIKVELIGESNISFHDLLTSGRSELDRLGKNDKLVQALEIEDFRMFPIYIHEFKLKVVYLRQARRRSRLLEKSKEVFVVCIADLPDSCMDVVFDHFNDRDLENLVRVRYPLLGFAEHNDSKCEGYLSDYDHDYEKGDDNDGGYYINVLLDRACNGNI